jgi:hypothetical protein
VLGRALILAEQIGGYRAYVGMDRSAIDAGCIDTTDRVGEATGFRGFRKEHIMPGLVCQ